MNAKRKLFITSGAAFAALVVIMVITLLPSNLYLTLRNHSTGEILLKHPVSNGDTFAVAFIHSVNQSPVTEIYEIREKTIYLTAVEFESFGAGMETDLAPNQTLERTADGKLRITNLNRPLNSLVYLIGPTAGHTLLISSLKIPLHTLDSPGQPVSFSVGG
jgi:hypothetical protein